MSLAQGIADLIRGSVRRLRRVARYIKYTPDRWLHPLRRRRAAARISELGPIETVLFICYGNICRSPYAAAIFPRLLPEARRGDFTITQAGLYGHDRYSPGQAIESAFLRGIDLSEHRSTLLSPELAAEAGLVVVMSREQEVAVRDQFGVQRERVLILGDLDPLPIETRTITDPYARSARVFEESYARIDRALERLVVILSGSAPGALVESEASPTSTPRAGRERAEEYSR